MRRLHLKLFYLRTRLKREAQGLTAKVLGVRPATMSHLEQGRSQPTLPMLLALCKHYDVTPTYLLDDERPIDPQSRDRWSERDNVVARGSWLEVGEGALVTAHDGARLVAVQPGARHYDAAAQAQRLVCTTPAAARELETGLGQAGRQRDQELEDALTRELLGQRKPRGKPVDKSIAKSALAQMAQG
jgi:transcriptional regulator with XRE-family HTH domain